MKRTAVYANRNCCDWCQTGLPAAAYESKRDKDGFYGPRQMSEWRGRGSATVVKFVSPIDGNYVRASVCPACRPKLLRLMESGETTAPTEEGANLEAYAQSLFDKLDQAWADRDLTLQDKTARLANDNKTEGEGIMARTATKPARKRAASAKRTSSKAPAAKAAPVAAAPEKETKTRRSLDEKIALGRKINARVKKGETVTAIASELGMYPFQALQLTMLPKVADGQVPAIKGSGDVLVKRLAAARKKADEFSSWDWLQARSGISKPNIQKMLLAAGFDVGDVRSKRTPKKAAAPAKRSATKRPAAKRATAPAASAAKTTAKAKKAPTASRERQRHTEPAKAARAARKPAAAKPASKPAAKAPAKTTAKRSPRKPVVTEPVTAPAPVVVARKAKPAATSTVVRKSRKAVADPS